MGPPVKIVAVEMPLGKEALQMGLELDSIGLCGHLIISSAYLGGSARRQFKNSSWPQSWFFRCSRSLVTPEAMYYGQRELLEPIKIGAAHKTDLDRSHPGPWIEPL